MRLRGFQGIANTLGEKLVAWRDRSDLEVIASLPDGFLEVDLLGGRATHSASGDIELRALGRLQDWLRARTEALGLSETPLCSVTLSASYRTDRVDTNHNKVVLFDWTCVARLETDARVFTGREATNDLWFTRVAAAAG